jgi:thiol-disulfide isomerase/thioredoxin
VRRAFIAATIALAACAASQPPGPALVPAAAAPALAPLELRLLSGEPWSSQAARGRVMVIDVWATYCKPCRGSFPKLNRLAADHPDVVVVGVSVDEDDAVVKAFLAEVPATFTIARDPELSVQDPPHAISRLPTVLVVDRAGRVRFRGDELSESSYDALPGLVERILAEPWSAPAGAGTITLPMRKAAGSSGSSVDR